MLHTSRAVILFILLTLVAAAPLGAQLVVTPSNLQGWQFVPSNGAGNVPPPAVYLAPGFETPPLGTGSVHLAVGQDGNDAARLRQPNYAGTLLSSITALSYSTFTEVDGSGGQSPYLILSVDNTGDGVADAGLFFEPVYQTGAYAGDPVPNQGALVTDTWQTWDALVGGWWVGTGGPPLVTLASYIAANPTATIVNTGTGLGGVSIVAGFGAGAWDNFLGAADNLTIGVSGNNTTYDFEPATAAVVTVTPSTLDGWTLQVVDDDTDTVTPPPPSFVTGPGTPPMGDGSLEFTFGTEGEDGVQARQIGYDGQFIRDLADFTYSTYVQVAGSGGQAPYIILDVDLNNDGVRDDLWFFEPVYQTGAFCPENPQPAVATGSWQTWDASNGCWYSLFGTAGTGPGVNVAPLSVLLDAEPDARISTSIAGGSIRVVTGFGDLAWDGFVGNADAVTIDFLGNSTTYDFEPVPNIIIGDVTQAEGTIGTTNFVFNLTLSEAVSQTVTVDYSTADGTATTADGDYTQVVTGTATFTPQSTATTITIVVTADNKFELDENFFVNLTNPQFATISDAQGTGTIQNDDAQPTINIPDLGQPEGSGGGTTNFQVPVTLSNPSYLTVTVNYTTNPGTATEGTDYTDATGTLTFVPGDTSELVTVPVAADTIFEADETLTIDLSAPTNATISDNQSTVTIQNDDAQPTISINDVPLAEGNAGTTPFVFTVTLSNASSQTITVNYTTNPGTATEGTDYADATGTLTFVPGDVSETITVLVNGDLTFEPNETFFVDLSAPSNATILDNQGLGTIIDDEGQPSILITDVSLAEGNAGTTPFIFTVTLSHASATPVTVNFTTNPGTATEGTDYLDATGIVTFVPGDVSETITVTVNTDTGFEPNETFTVDLSGATGATLLDNQGVGTILNDDGPIADVSITKTGPASVAGNSNFTYTITVSNAGPQSASNVVVTDTLPLGLTFVSATPSQGNCAGTSTVICTLGAIASGGTATIALTVTAPTSGSFTNTATVTNTPETDPTPANNAGTFFNAVGSSDIPTLSEWALIALMAALLAMAVLKLK